MNILIEQEVIDRFNGTEYSFLSNFYPSVIHCAFFTESLNTGLMLTCPTVEHAYQMSKTFNEVEIRKVLAARSPGRAKRLGQTVTKRPDWETPIRGIPKKVYIMQSFLEMKFFQNPNLGQLLVNTGNAQLIEGNTWNDTFWGVCNGVGENWLGRLLMRVRQDYQKYLTIGEEPFSMCM